MKRLRMFYTIGLSFLLIQLFVTAGFAQDNKFQFGIQIGAIVPQNFQIQGLYQVSYVDGSPMNGFVSGFGNGTCLNVSAFYYFSDWGINLKSGIHLFQKHTLDMAFAPDGIRDYYENNLIIIPSTISLVNRLNLPNSSFIPYYGLGVGVLVANWEQKHFPEGSDRTWLTGSATSVDFQFLAGFDFPLYHDILFNGEFGYSYAPTNWEIENVDNNNMTQIKNLNMGGVAIKLGVAYRF
ncbi:hypothetical protein ACFLQX_00170 [Bacteroidota bacterium]